MDLVVAEYLCDKFISPEGDLSKLRAALVNETSLLCALKKDKFRR